MFTSSLLHINCFMLKLWFSVWSAFSSSTGCVMHFLPLQAECSVVNGLLIASHESPSVAHWVRTLMCSYLTPQWTKSEQEENAKEVIIISGSFLCLALCELLRTFMPEPPLNVWPFTSKKDMQRLTEYLIEIIFSHHTCTFHNHSSYCSLFLFYSIKS